MRCLASTLLSDGYLIRVWQTEDGLPENVVTSVVQTHDGFLWIGTFGGLARFDGDQFRIFNSTNCPNLQDGRIVRLFEDDRGSLWIGHGTGLITRYRAGQFEESPSLLGKKRESVRAIGSDEWGRVWALRDGGDLDALEDGTHLPSLVPNRQPDTIAWTRSREGRIWITENGKAAQLANGSLIPIRTDVSEPFPFALCVAAAADGGVWIIGDNRIRKFRDGRWTEDRGTYPWASSAIACALELRDGTLAVGTVANGLYLIFQDGKPSIHFDRSNGLPQNWVRCLYEDREGNLWFGTGSAGLAAIHQSAFAVVNTPGQWKAQTVLSVAAGLNGALWVGTEGTGLYQLSGSRWTHYGEAEGLSNPFVWAVDEDPTGQVWVGTWEGGPFRLENGRITRPANIELAPGPIRAIEYDSQRKGILIGNRDGLLSINGNQSTWIYKTKDGSSANVSAVLRDRQGIIWFGFADGGLARFAADHLTTFRGQDGLAGEGVQCLYSDDDGSLWIGTAEGGIARFKSGRIARIGVAQGLADNVVSHIVDDGLGNFWLSTLHGIQQVAKKELNRCADGLSPTFSSQIYDHNDGLPTIDVDGLQAAGCKTTDGRLWFTSSKGIISIDPVRIQHNPTPPPVLLESLIVDGRSQLLVDDTAPNRLPPGHQQLEFRFAGLSFVAPGKVFFKYRLDGIDENWVDAGSRRIAFYSRLAAGTYRFQVIACNEDGVWNTKGAMLAFTVSPFFWQTWWFLSSLALLILTGAASFARALTRRRLRHRMDMLERQHAIERERTRIAQDIHDDIGISLTRIAMFSQPDREEVDEPRQTDKVLSRIYSTTHEITQSLDEIVWAIDPRHDTLDSFVSYVTRFAQDMLGTANIRCRLDLPDELPAWPMTTETRHNLFLALKEALNNSVRHAAATEVRILLQLGIDSLILIVSDNGRGFDRARPSSTAVGRILTGNGLANLESRLARVGGTCEISAAAGRGTSIKFSIRFTN
jgi:signal transduction histidine kinase/ligand-binding sensor domain-containing protein